MERIETSEAGFTLIELLIVVAIIAVLAALALVSYNYYTYKAKSAAGSAYMFEVARAEESFRALNGYYVSDCNTLKNQFDLPASGRYHILDCTITLNGTTGFEAIAKAQFRTGLCTDEWRIKETAIPCQYVDGTGTDCTTKTCPSGY